MFKIQRSPAWPPTLDLSTVRETIAYMECDLRRIPGLEAAANSLKAAIGEIETAERRSRPWPQGVLAAKFFARS